MATKSKKQKTAIVDEEESYMRGYTEDHLDGMQELQDQWEDEVREARQKLLRLFAEREKASAVANTSKKKKKETGKPSRKKRKT